MRGVGRVLLKALWFDVWLGAGMLLDVGVIVAVAVACAWSSAVH